MCYSDVLNTLQVDGTILADGKDPVDAKQVSDGVGGGGAGEY